MAAGWDGPDPDLNQYTLGSPWHWLLWSVLWEVIEHWRATGSPSWTDADTGCWITVWETNLLSLPSAWIKTRFIIKLINCCFIKLLKIYFCSWPRPAKYCNEYVTFDGQKCASFPIILIVSSLVTEIVCFILFIYIPNYQIKVSSFSHCDSWIQGWVIHFFINSVSNHLGNESKRLLKPV